MAGTRRQNADFSLAQLGHVGSLRSFLAGEAFKFKDRDIILSRVRKPTVVDSVTLRARLNSQSLYLTPSEDLLNFIMTLYLCSNNGGWSKVKIIRGH